MLFIITENKDILNKTLPFVDELSIVYSRSVKELTDYRIVQSEDVVLLANGETVNSNVRKKFPEQTTLIDLGKNGGVENLDLAYLFIKVLGRPRLGAYLHDQENLLNSTAVGSKNKVEVVTAANVAETKDVTVKENDKKVKSKPVAKKEPVKKVEKDVPVKKEPEIKKETIEEEVIIKPKRKHLVDTELEGVQEQLLSEGIPGMAIRNVEITYTDGVETGRKILRDTFKVIKEPVPAKYIVSAEKDRMTPPNQKSFEKDSARPVAPKSEKKAPMKQNTNKPVKATKIATNRLGSSIAKDEKPKDITEEIPTFVDETSNSSEQEQSNDFPTFVDVVAPEKTDSKQEDEFPTFVDVDSESSNNTDPNEDDFPTFEDSIPSMFRTN